MAEISEMQRKMNKALKRAEEPKFIMRIDDVQKARLVTLAKAHHLDNEPINRNFKLFKSR